jgi:hypothetical protein
MNHTSINKYSEKQKSVENQPKNAIIFSADTTSYLQKPPDSIFGSISNGILDGYRFDSTVKDIAFNYISQGKAISPAIFIEERSQDGFYAAQSIWLDFDSKERVIHPEDVHQRLLDYGIHPNIFYHTYSHTTDHPRFRFVIALDRVIRNGEAYQYLLNGFNQIFSEKDGYRYLDQSCIMDISRVYLATNPDWLVDYQANQTYELNSNGTGNEKQVIYYGNQSTGYDDLKLLIDSVFTRPFDKNCNGFRKVKDFDITRNTHCIYADESGKPYDWDKIKVISKDKQTQFSTNQLTKQVTYDRKYNYIFNNTCGDTSSSSDSLNPDNQLVINILRNICFSHMRKTLKIVDDFFRGRMLMGGEYVEKNFDYHTLKLFAISFLRIEGGIKWMLDTMSLHRDNGLGYKDEDFALIKNLQSKRYKNKYKNPNLQSFSPHQQDHFYKSIYDAAKGVKHGGVERIEGKLPQPINLSLAEQRLKDTFKTVYDDKTPGRLDLIQAGIGLGKTSLLVEEIVHQSSGTIIAFVTHQMKRQFIGDLNQKGYREGVDYIVTPQIPTFINQEYNFQLQYLFDNQQFKKAKQYIHSIWQKDASTNDALAAKEYLAKYDGFINAIIYERFAGTILTTHSMCHFFEFGKLSKLHRTIIYDEDLYSGGLISTDYFMLDDLKRLSEKDKKYKKEYQRLLNKGIGIYQNGIHIPNAHIENQINQSKSLIEKGLYYKLLELKKSKGYAVITERKRGKDIYKLLYGKRINLKPNMKYIVLSGTAPEGLYRFENIEVSIHNQSKYVVHRGALKQYTGKSFSQSSLAKSDKLPENPDGLPVITFQKHKGLFQGATEDIHFFNALGYNDLKGKDLVIVGTPHLNPYALAILALETGLDIDLNDENLLKMANQRVEFNGLRFKLYTYVNDVLRELTMQLTESELQQAIGRARMLRHDSTVHLYSNFPLWQTDDFVY